MITEGIESLNEMFRQTEVLREGDILRMLEDMGHLQGDGLNQALCVLCQLLVGLGRWSILRSNLENPLNLLQGLDTPCRIVAENTGDRDCDVVRSVVFRLVKLLFDRTSSRDAASVTVGREDVVRQRP